MFVRAIFLDVSGSERVCVRVCFIQEVCPMSCNKTLYIRWHMSRVAKVPKNVVAILKYLSIILNIYDEIRSRSLS